MTDVAELIELREKYLRMRALRTAADDDRARGVAHAPDRSALQSLSHRFPGALAEIDRLTPARLDARIAELEHAIAERRAPAPWMRGWILAHAGLRGALAIKRWLGGRRQLDAQARAAFDAADLPPEARAFRERLDVVAAPPGGRLVDVIFADVAQTLGIEASAVRALLMPRD